MKTPFLILIGLALWLPILTIPAHAQNSAPTIPTPYDSVDPFIGTAGGGNTFPGATLPNGMIQWSPDTTPDAWYRYTDPRITGFSLTHISGAGCPLYGDIPILPTTAELTVSPHANPGLYAQPFSHARESAHPGYYSVVLANGIEVRITVTTHAGIAHFRFPLGSPARLLLNPGGSANSTLIDKQPANPARAHDGYTIRIPSTTAVEGEARAGAFCGSPTRYTLYFAAQFDHPFVRTAMWNDDAIDPSAQEESARHAGAWLDFGSQRDITMKVGISFVSVANARANLALEIPNWDFGIYHHYAERDWSRLLNQIEITGGTPAQRTIFYTGLYHMFLSPNFFTDANGDYIGFDGLVHQMPRLCIGPPAIGTSTPTSPTGTSTATSSSSSPSSFPSKPATWPSPSSTTPPSPAGSRAGPPPTTPPTSWAATRPPSSSPTPSPSARARSTPPPRSTP